MRFWVKRFSAATPRTMSAIAVFVSVMSVTVPGIPDVFKHQIRRVARIAHLMPGRGLHTGQNPVHFRHDNPQPNWKQQRLPLGSWRIRAVQELLGHASVATTQIYTAVEDEVMRRAVNFAA